MKQIEKTITSIDVAEMIEKKHSELLKDIRRYTEQLNEVNIPLVDFFQEKTYKDAKGETRPCYNVTKKGCEFIAHKLTGLKGTEFTAKYINRFHDMEEQIVNPFEGISQELQAVIVVDKRITEVDEKVSKVDRDLQQFKQELPILGVEESKITNAVKRKGVHVLGGKESNAYHDKSICKKVYSDIYAQLKRQFGVSTYKAIKRSQSDLAVKIVNEYEAPIALAEIIKDCNSQINLEVF